MKDAVSLRETGMTPQLERLRRTEARPALDATPAAQPARDWSNAAASPAGEGLSEAMSSFLTSDRALEDSLGYPNFPLDLRDAARTLERSVEQLPSGADASPGAQALVAARDAVQAHLAAREAFSTLAAKLIKT